MRKFGRVMAVAAAIALTAPLAQAQAVDSKAAKKMLFGTGSEVQVAQVDFIDAATAKAIRQAAGSIPYYGAIAVSPGEPLSSNLMSTAANHHSPQGAQEAALTDCNARRTTGKPCVVIATITPKRFKPRPLTLSVEATRVFGNEYRKLSAPKALAISPSTGVFGAERGDGARAISKCNSAAGARGAADCRVVIFDQ